MLKIKRAISFILATPAPSVSNIENPCSYNHCGANSLCRNEGDIAVCSCLPKFHGVPPNCHKGCNWKYDCPSNQICVSQYCTDPCPGACGAQAICEVIDHIPTCVCPKGYIGDAGKLCTPKHAGNYRCNYHSAAKD